MSARATALVVIGLVAAAVLIAERQPSEPADVAAVDAQSGTSVRPTVAVQPETAAPAERPRTKKDVASRPTAAPAPAVAVKTHTDPALADTPPAEPVKVATAEPASMPAPVASTAVAPVESSTTTRTEASAPVTITGCLEHDAQRFWLTDTSGANVPKSRSWKTGFLRKHSSTIDLVDAADLRLPSYVGQRVAVTGTLRDREMRARGLRRVGASCRDAN